LFAAVPQGKRIDKSIYDTFLRYMLLLPAKEVPNTMRAAVDATPEPQD
jgi:hypothetical protein